MYYHYISESKMNDLFCEKKLKLTVCDIYRHFLRQFDITIFLLAANQNLD